MHPLSIFKSNGVEYAVVNICPTLIKSLKIEFVFWGSALKMVFFFFFQALNFLVEGFGLLNDIFPFPSILDAVYPVFDLYLANVLFNVILPSVLGSSL